MKPSKKKALIILAAFLSLLMVLNPSEKRHKAAITAFLVKYYGHYPADPGEVAFVDRQSYHNFLVFSTTSDGERLRPTSIGFCGKTVVLFGRG